MSKDRDGVNEDGERGRRSSECGVGSGEGEDEEDEDEEDEEEEGEDEEEEDFDGEWEEEEDEEEEDEFDDSGMYDSEEEEDELGEEEAPRKVAINRELPERAKMDKLIGYLSEFEKRGVRLWGDGGGEDEKGGEGYRDASSRL